MRYEHIKEGIFLERPNRFIARVEVKGRVVTAHVKNTGRCRELLIPGVPVILQYHPGGLAAGRKTEYSLIGVWKGDILINMDSQAPNQAAMEWLLNGGFTRDTGISVSEVRREVAWGDSRLDLSFLADGEPALMEVKGVTLEMNHGAMFPDAPTLRGIKHLKELETAAQNGIRAYVLFVIQMKAVTWFTPNMDTHPAFGAALREASEAGVKVLAYDCIIQKDSMTIDQAVKVVLPHNYPFNRFSTASTACRYRD